MHEFLKWSAPILNPVPQANVKLNEESYLCVNSHIAVFHLLLQSTLNYSVGSKMYLFLSLLTKNLNYTSEMSLNYTCNFKHF